MVAPLLAAGGRLVAGSARVKARRAVTSDVKRSVTAANDARLSAIAINRSLQRQAADLETAFTVAELQQLQQQAANQNKQPKLTLTERVKKVRRQMRALSATAQLATWYYWAYGVQVACGFLYIASEWFEYETIAGYVYPGVWLMKMSWMIIITIGTIIMLAALVRFVTARLTLSKSAIVLSFPICFAGYIAPYFFFLPWVMIWAFIVVWCQE